MKLLRTEPYISSLLLISSWFFILFVFDCPGLKLSAMTVAFQSLPNLWRSSEALGWSLCSQPVVTAVARLNGLTACWFWALKGCARSLVPPPLPRGSCAPASPISGGGRGRWEQSRPSWARPGSPSSQPAPSHKLHKYLSLRFVAVCYAAFCEPQMTATKLA